MKYYHNWESSRYIIEMKRYENWRRRRLGKSTGRIVCILNNPYSPWFTVTALVIVAVGMGKFMWEVSLPEKPASTIPEQFWGCRGNNNAMVQRLIRLSRHTEIKRVKRGVTRLGEMGADAEAAIPRLKEIQEEHEDQELLSMIREAITRIEMERDTVKQEVVWPPWPKS